MKHTKLRTCKSCGGKCTKKLVEIDGKTKVAWVCEDCENIQ